ncbi:hypothetical protein [Phenylobacterium sp.]|jgi:hypothetical protein|uniref:hypothetical protein n=1 Tax=Phenylobacterium sp. TaxID=1871053 RepID=UPI002D784146|nr:hypothetical protein [Phenylobacterium sp.]
MIAAALLLADTPAATPAAPPAPTVPAAANAAQTAPAKTAAATSTDRVVCKTESVTGSMFPKKVCYSTQQAAERRQDERQNLEKIQNLSH